MLLFNSSCTHWIQKIQSHMMLKLTHHIVTCFGRLTKLLFFCNLLTTANSDRKTTEKSRNYSPTAKRFARIAIVCVEFRKHHIYTCKLAKLFSCTKKKLNPLNLLTCMNILFIACYYWKQFFLVCCIHIYYQWSLPVFVRNGNLRALAIMNFLGITSSNKKKGSAWSMKNNAVVPIYMRDPVTSTLNVIFVIFYAHCYFKLFSSKIHPANHLRHFFIDHESCRCLSKNCVLQ